MTTTQQQNDNAQLAQSYGLTAEDWAILEAPVPASEIKSYEGKGHKQMRYTSVEFVESRLAQVDPNFSREVSATTNSIIVHYTVKGIRRGDVFDVEKGEVKYGTPTTNALAHACRRAAKSGFHVARELWQDAPEEDEDSEQEQSQDHSKARAQTRQTQGSRGSYTTSSNTANGTGFASPAQIKFLVDAFGVPEQIAEQLKSGKFDPKKDQPGTGTASELIDALKEIRNDIGLDLYDEDPEAHVLEALKTVSPRLARQMPGTPSRR